MYPVEADAAGFRQEARRDRPRCYGCGSQRVGLPLCIGFSDVVPSQDLALAGSPASFTVLGPDAGRDRLRIGAGLSWDVSDDMTVRARYDGLFSDSQANHAGLLGLNIRF